jgi:predicted peptidase
MAYWYFTEGEAQDKIPILLFLHGAGESAGDPVAQVTKHGPWSGSNPAVSDRLRRFLRVAPHLDQRSYWNADNLRDLVGQVRQRYHDARPDRLVIAGISRGGKGALDLVAAHGAELRPAGVMVCCPEHVDRLAATLERAPVYLFHGDGDSVVPLDEARAALYDRLSQRPNFRWVRVHASWTLGERRHNCWTHLFRHPDLYAWLAGLLDDAAYGASKQRWPDFASLQRSKAEGTGP